MKNLYLLALFPILLSAQQRQPVTSLQPDCMVFFNLTVASSGAQAAGTVTAGSPGTSVLIDNHQAACYGWTVAYASHGFTVESLHFQSAPDNATGTAPGTWADFAGTLIACTPGGALGINPNTATTQAITCGTGYFPWLRMNLISVSGTGGISGVLFGFKVNSASRGTGGSGLCPGGSPTELQYNSSGNCAGIPNSSWDGLNLNIQDSGANGNIFTFSSDLVNGDPDCGGIFVINCDRPSPPSVSGGNGTLGPYAAINGINGSDTTFATGTGGTGGEGDVFAGNGGIASGGTTATGGLGGNATLYPGGGGIASGIGANVGGKGGDALIYGQAGGAAIGGASNTGGDAGLVRDLLQPGGAGATANGLDGYAVVDGSALRGNRPDKILAKWITPGSGPVPAIHINGAVGLGTILFANLGTGLEGDVFDCSNCTVTSSIDNTCASGTSKAVATYLGGVWKCGL